MDHAKQQQQWRQYLKELSDLQITNHRLTVKNVEVGSGGAGLVKLAIMDENFENRQPQRVAVKELRPIGIRNDRERMAIRLVRELRVWATLKHPNIIALSGYHLDENTFETACLYSPYCERGSLPVYMKSGDLSEACRLQLALDTALGLEYLHNHKPSICHGDIKGDNVLINDRIHAILCDFGLSRVMDDSKKHSGLTTQLVSASQRYASPELLDDDEGKHTLESDIWAWGCLLLEIMSDRIPFAEVTNQSSVMVKIVIGEKPAAPEDVSVNAEIRSLAAKCWAGDPKSRPRLTRCAEVLRKALEDQSALIMTVLLDNPLGPNTFGSLKISGARTAADIWRMVIDELYITPPCQPLYYLRLQQQSEPLMGAELLSYCSERANGQESPTLQIKCAEGQDDIHDIDRKVFILASLQTTASDDLDKVVDRISAVVAKFDTEVTYQWLRFTARGIWLKCRDDSELVTCRAMARLCRKFGNELKGNVRFREKGNTLPVTAGPAFKARIINHSYNYFGASFPSRSNSDRPETPFNSQHDRRSSFLQPSDIRAVNAVRFIACLYREDVLPWDDVRHYLDALTEGIRQNDGLKIQCLCTLLTVVGRWMETKEKDSVDRAFGIISKALSAASIDGSKIDLKSRKALEDLVKFRQAKWRGTPVAAASTTPEHPPPRPSPVTRLQIVGKPDTNHIPPSIPEVDQPQPPHPDTVSIPPPDSSSSKEYEDRATGALTLIPLRPPTPDIQIPPPDLSSYREYEDRAPPAVTVAPFRPPTPDWPVVAPWSYGVQEPTNEWYTRTPELVFDGPPGPRNPDPELDLASLIHQRRYDRDFPPSEPPEAVIVIPPRIPSPPNWRIMQPPYYR